MLRGSKYGAGLIVALGLALLTLLGVGWAYQNRAPWILNVGEPGDQPFVDPAGVYGDEADIDYRYRWTREHAELTLRDIGWVDAPLLLTLRAQGYRPAPEPPPTITVTVNGAWRTTVPLTTSLASYVLGPIPKLPAANSLVIAIDSPTFTPPGDARPLGIKLDRVSVDVRGPLPLILPPGGVLLAAVAAVLGLFGLLWRLLAGQADRVQWAGAAGGAALGLLALEVGLVGLGLQTTWALGQVGLPLGLLGLAAAAWPGWRVWPDWVDRLIEARNYTAPLLLALLLAGYGLAALVLLPQVDWIGHADYADNAVVARNLAAGRGYVVDYVAQFYKDYPGITHPAETWPILQPTLIAPFFLAFGPETWAARLPNLLLLLALAGAVYVFGSRWWDRRVGLLAAAFTLFHPYFFQTVLYPINDLAFTLLALLTIALAWEAVQTGETRLALDVSGQWTVGSGQRTAVAIQEAEDPDAPDDPQHSALSTQHSALSPPVEAQFTGLDMRLARRREALLRRGRRLLIAAGVAAGLLVWSKPTGLVLVVGLAGALWLRHHRTRWAGRPPGTPQTGRGTQHKGDDIPQSGVPSGPPVPHWAWAVGPFVLVLLPLLARNLLTFGAPYYSTEGTDAWVLRYWAGDPQVWERIYALYTGPGRSPPHPRELLGGSFDALFGAVGRGFAAVWEAAFLRGEVLPLPLALGAAAGWLLAPRRLYGLLGAWAGAFGFLILLILVYWHYEARYFLTLVPWLYLGLAAGLFWLWDQARARRPADAVAYGPGRLAPWLLPVAVLLVLGPALTTIREQAAAAQGPDAFAVAGRWLAANSPPDAVVMSRDPWELNWYSRRKVVMIPWGPLEDIRTVGRQYGVTYLWVGGPSWRFRRPQVEPLLDRLAVREVYRSADGGIRIYRWEP